jgi:hypothetical protein
MEAAVADPLNESGATMTRSGDIPPAWQRGNRVYMG